MSYSTPTSDQLGTLLALQVDVVRADLLIGFAESLAKSIVSPLPDGAQVVVLSAAARAYVNPSGAQSETTGPITAAFGPSSPGVWLIRSERATLRRLAGSGGAFTVDLTPVDAGTDLYPWDENLWEPSFDGDVLGIDPGEPGEWQ